MYLAVTDGPLLTAGPPYVTAKVLVTSGVSVILLSSVSVSFGVLVGTVFGVAVFSPSSHEDEEDAEVAGATCVGSNKAVIVLSGVGKEKGVGVENPGSVQPVRIARTVNVTRIWRNLIFSMEIPSSMRFPQFL